MKKKKMRETKNWITPPYLLSEMIFAVINFDSGLNIIYNNIYIYYIILLFFFLFITLLFYYSIFLLDGGMRVTKGTRVED